jgi:hypothetical protein
LDVLGQPVFACLMQGGGGGGVGAGMDGQAGV